MPEEHWIDLPLHLVALKFALRELERGVSETDGPNDSPAIRRYLKEAGIHRPEKWCAAFCNWAARRAAMLKGTQSPLEQVRFEAYVQSYYDWAEEEERVIEADELGPGDLFVLYDASAPDPVYGGIGRHVHMGFVHRPPFDGRKFDTVEGNTDEDGGREGVEVGALTREVTDGTHFIRWHP